MRTMEVIEKEFLETIENYLDKGNKLKWYEVESLICDFQVAHIQFSLDEIDRRLKEMMNK